MRKIFQTMFSRTVLFGISILIQAYILVMVIWKFSNYFVEFYSICTLLSVSTVLWIVNGKSNPAYKIAWIIPIMIVPIFGGLFYLIFGGNKMSKKNRKKMEMMALTMNTALGQNQQIYDNLEKENLSAANQSNYIKQYSFCPVYQNTLTEYLPTGEMKYEKMIEELKKAKEYIFLEYFIINEGVMWNTILEVLKEKAKSGVDVRVIYDDVGCLLTLPFGYEKQLESMGIKCCVFNPFIPLLSARMNNRNHRKIAVIDGQTAFTGGINLADEYINGYVKYGHWKDSAIMLKGDAVWSLTVMFLSMWGYLRKINEDYEQFKPILDDSMNVNTQGYVQPFNDTPLDDEPVGETVYLNLINTAERYVYINTPYLILDNEMTTSLSMAAKRGIDVRIITPHIPDKWYVHEVSRSYYEVLVESGVHLYEYTPGFLHSKTFVVDDQYAVVGTINLDYRSLYLHFECGVWLYNTTSVLAVKEDYLQTLEVCSRITLEACQSIKWYKKLERLILRAFAPLM